MIAQNGNSYYISTALKIFPHQTVGIFGREAE